MKDFSVRSLFKSDPSGFKYYDPNLNLHFVVDYRDFREMSDDQLSELIKNKRKDKIIRFSSDTSKDPYDLDGEHVVDVKLLSPEEQDLITKPLRDFRQNNESFKNFFNSRPL
jgi:hypothetical protein